MRWVGWLLFVLTLAAWVACELPVPRDSRATSATTADATATWRRTDQGWEPASAWRLEAPDFFEPPLHPGLIAAMLLLLSVLALVALPGSSAAAVRRQP